VIWGISWGSFWHVCYDVTFLLTTAVVHVRHWVKTGRWFAMFLYGVYIIWEREGTTLQIDFHTDHWTLLWFLIFMECILLCVSIIYWALSPSNTTIHQWTLSYNVHTVHITANGREYKCQSNKCANSIV
jgi:hypothetical protein